MAGGQLRHLIVLLIGFSASLIVSSTFVRPSLPYQAQPIVQQNLIVFLLPTTATVVYLVVRSLQRWQLLVADALTPDKAVRSIVFWILLFLTGVHLILLTVLVVGVQAIQPWAYRSVVILVGLTLVAIGNLLPRTRPNIALGIRTSQTLTDRRLWMLIHRVGGYICVAVGMVTVLAAALLSGPRVAAVSGGAGLAGATILFVYYQKLSYGSRTSRRIPT
jgi:SdpI/YfhL protein family